MHDSRFSYLPVALQCVSHVLPAQHLLLLEGNLQFDKVEEHPARVEDVTKTSSPGCDADGCRKVRGFEFFLRNA